MKFLADVNIPQSVITHLSSLGHDVLDLKKVNLIPKYKTPTIVFRLTKQNPQGIIEKLRELLKNQKEEILKKSLTIVRDKVADSHPQ